MSKFRLPFNVTAATSGITTQSVANQMPASMEKAPYLYQAAMTSYMSQDALNDKVVAKSGGDLTIADQRLVWDMGIQVIAEAVAANIKVETDIFTAEAAVSGSVPYANSAPTAANEVYVRLTPTKYFRDMTEKIPYADSASDLPFTVRTIVEPAESGKAPDPSRISAGKSAYLVGSDFTSDLTVKFVNNASGAETAATVTRVMSTTATLAVPPGLPGGEYTLAVTCTGKGRTAITQKKPSNVIVAALTTPYVTTVSQEGVEEENTVVFLNIDDPVTISGYNLGDVTASMLQTVIRDKTTGEEIARSGLDVSGGFTATDTAITLPGGLVPAVRDIPDGDHCHNRAFLVFNLADGTVYEHEFTYKE